MSFRLWLQRHPHHFFQKKVVPFLHITPMSQVLPSAYHFLLAQVFSYSGVCLLVFWLPLGGHKLHEDRNLVCPSCCSRSCCGNSVGSVSERFSLFIGGLRNRAGKERKQIQIQAVEWQNLWLTYTQCSLRDVDGNHQDWVH
jgi:hypothetical protein